MRKLLPAFLILTLLACKAERSLTPSAPAAATTTSSTGRIDAFGRNVVLAHGAPAQAMEAGLKVSDAQQNPDVQRMIVRSANISMIVDDTAATLDKITAAGESVGGYISESKVWRDGEQLRGAVTLRIPADRLSAALAVIRKLAVRINSETIGSQEVTQEYVDLESQLRNLEAAEVELRQLMTTIRERSKRAAEVLEMYQQLSTIRAQIEQIKGRMRYLSQMSAHATLQVDLIPNALAKPVVEPGVWQPVVIAKEAARSLVEALQSVAGVAIWFVIYILPILAMLGLAVLLGWKLLARVARRSETAV